MARRTRVTIRDVAAKAGVSHQTVSRVINRSQRVRPETRARVEQAISDLGYTPNAIARFMARGATRTLACLSPNLSDYTFATIIEGAETEARSQGYLLFIASAPDEQEFQALVEELVTSGRTEGLMVINPYNDYRFTHLPGGFPTVFVGAHPPAGLVSSVCLDDSQAAYQAVRHLIDLGHRLIAMITGPLAEDCSQDRVSGYREALRAAGQSADPGLTVEGDWSATAGYQAVQQLLSLPKPFSAIFAQNDRMAVGAAKALRESGLRIPEDISVIGFDDMPLASYFDPPLTTMRQDTAAIGRRAARLLIAVVEQPDQPESHLLEQAYLINRQSTGKFSQRRW